MEPRTEATRKFVEQAPPGGLDVITRHATDPPLAIRTIVDAITEDLPAQHRVIELGFGSGWLLQELLAVPGARLYALDMAPWFIDAAMRTTGSEIAIVRGDMEQLPFRDASFDVVTTNWTLYFMGDLDAALAGMRRCIRRGGRLVAATVAPDHMMEFEALAADALRAATGRDPEEDAAARFNTATGMAPMKRAFASVELREWGGELLLPDVDSALALLPNWGPQQLPDDDRRSLEAEFAERVTAILHREGRWRITRHDGVFIALA